MKNVFNPFAAVRKRTIAFVLGSYMFLHAGILLQVKFGHFPANESDDIWLVVGLIVLVGLNSIVAAFSWMLFFVSVHLLDVLKFLRVPISRNCKTVDEKQRFIELQRLQAGIYLGLCVFCTLSFSIWLMLLTDKPSWWYALLHQVVSVIFGPLTMLPILHSSRGWRRKFRLRSVQERPMNNADLND